MNTDTFRAQMQALKTTRRAHHHHEDFLDWKLGDKQLPPSASWITIDDGWKSVYTDACPILREMKNSLHRFPLHQVHHRPRVRHEPGADSGNAEQRSHSGQPFRQPPVPQVLARSPEKGHAGRPGPGRQGNRGIQEDFSRRDSPVPTWKPIATRAVSSCRR